MLTIAKHCKQDIEKEIAIQEKRLSRLSFHVCNNVKKEFMTSHIIECLCFL